MTHSPDSPTGIHGAAGGIGLFAPIDKKSPKTVHLEVDLRVESAGLDNGGYARDPLVIQLVAEDEVPEGVALSLRPDETSAVAFALEDPDVVGPQNVRSQPIAAMPRDQWVSVAIEVERSATELRARVSFDGVKAGEVVVKRTQKVITAVVINVGSQTPAIVSQPFVAAFDNVVVDVD